MHNAVMRRIYLVHYDRAMGSWYLVGIHSRDNVAMVSLSG